MGICLATVWAWGVHVVIDTSRLTQHDHFGQSRARHLHDRGAGFGGIVLFGELLARVTASVETLPDKPEETPENTLRALWFTASGCPRSAEYAAQGILPALDTTQVKSLRGLVQQRLSGVPLSYLTGRQRFLDLEMHAAYGALIPRKETEILGRAALSLIHDAASRQGYATVLDVCTGSGNLALAYAAHEPRARVHAADLSNDAIAVAAKNARLVALADKVEFRTGDLLAPFGNELNGKVDVLSCNPPYMSTAKATTMPATIARHEPLLAFDGGPFGINILTRVTKESVRLMRPGGWVCLEVGRGQGPHVAHRIERLSAYGAIRTFTDRAGEIRALAAQVRAA
jgi:release factor glutamine methyltransferase